MWREFPAAVRAVEAIASVRAVLVFAEGRHFCTGIDIEFLKDTFLPFAQPPASRSEGLHDNGSSSGSRPGPNTPAPTPACPGLARESMRRGILGMQDAYSALERCRWPVIAAIHGSCIGGGIDLITACDIRICSSDATFCVKEVDVAIAADLGTLQRLPTIVGHGAAMHLALTAQTVSAGEALRLGLVSRVVEGSGQEAVRSAGVALAAQMAAKPSLALLGTKRVLLHARDHSVEDGLDYVATWNSAMLLSNDLVDIMTHGRSKGSKAAERPRAKM
ncbi:MAG: hypothetical protein WDW36_003948 [Sanguina aurantia]